MVAFGFIYKQTPQSTKLRKPCILYYWRTTLYVKRLNTMPSFMTKEVENLLEFPYGEPIKTGPVVYTV